MRFNDRELARLGEGRADLEGILHHMKPQENDWSDWYQQPSFKERTFRLVSNLLFYYRVNEPEPLGVIVLENAQIAYERPYKGIPFAFSIVFKVTEKYKDTERKHIFSCRCQEDVNKWVSSLKTASYEHWRSQFIILKTKISMRTGKDPVLDYIRNKHKTYESNVSEKRICAKKSTFHSHIDMKIDNANESISTNGDASNIVIGKLVDI
ncbi:hypothetical protein RN001_015924 [Aquatica leii]|uniref:Pleckstrin homology domain-containing family J member 1 n=1 Tax=Aquatica leii TaxID=1421715 RepID=A0AAN7SMX0_9COLE|nr:hypothetical protein RN001_015924 [Aquatica leii]